jgi:hypothetical protein
MGMGMISGLRWTGSETWDRYDLGYRWTGANGDRHDLRLEVDRIREKGKT